MAGLVPAIHVLLAARNKEDVDARHKAGHDDGEAGAEKMFYRGGLIASFRRLSTSGDAA
jgi:hypothetical protein